MNSSFFTKLGAAAAAVAVSSSMWPSGRASVASSSNKDAGPKPTAAMTSGSGNGISPKHVVVIGAGVVGISSAYALAKQGCKVTIVDTNKDAAAACSHGNAGMLRASSHGSMIPTRALMLSLVQSKGRFFKQKLCAQGMTASDASAGYSFVVPWTRLFDLAFIHFGAEFVMTGLRATEASTKEKADAATALTRYSVDQTARLVESIPGFGALCGFRRSGSLDVYGDATLPLLPGAQARAYGGSRAMDADELLTSEPCLSATNSTLVKAAMHHPQDCVASCPHFTRALAAHTVKSYPGQINFMWEHRAVGFSWDGEQTDCVTVTPTKGDDPIAKLLPCDAVLIAAGAECGSLIYKHWGERMPLTNVKGYSLSVTPVDVPKAGAAGTKTCPSNMLVNLDTKLFISTFGDTMRLASVAEFGQDTKVNTDVVCALWANMRRVYPGLLHKMPADATKLPWWVGLRTLSADGLPLIGPLYSRPQCNVFVNAGHGTGGFKLALGSGELVASMLTSTPLPKELEGIEPYFCLSRFRYWNWNT